MNTLRTIPLFSLAIFNYCSSHRAFKYALFRRRRRRFRLQKIVSRFGFFGTSRNRDLLKEPNGASFFVNLGRRNYHNKSRKNEKRWKSISWKMSHFIWILGILPVKFVCCVFTLASFEWIFKTSSILSARKIFSSS